MIDFPRAHGKDAEGGWTICPVYLRDICEIAEGLENVSYEHAEAILLAACDLHGWKLSDKEWPDDS